MNFSCLPRKKFPPKVSPLPALPKVGRVTTWTQMATLPKTAQCVTRRAPQLMQSRLRWHQFALLPSLKGLTASGPTRCSPLSVRRLPFQAILTSTSTAPSVPYATLTSSKPQGLGEVPTRPCCFGNRVISTFLFEKKSSQKKTLTFFPERKISKESHAPNQPTLAETKPSYKQRLFFGKKMRTEKKLNQACV